MSNAKGHVLVVDNDVSLLSLCRHVVEQAGLVAHTFVSAHQARDRAWQQQFDLALVGTDLPLGDGLSLLDQLRTGDGQLPILLLATHEADPLVAHAPRFAVQQVLLKPFSTRELHEIVANRHTSPLPSDGRAQPSPTLPHPYRRLIDERNPQRLYERSVEMIRAKLKANRATLLLWDASHQALTLLAQAGQPLDMELGREGRSTEAIAYHVAVSGQPVLLGTAEQQGDEVLLTVPLLLGEQVLGVLQAARAEPNHAFTHKDRELLELLAGQVAAAIEHARLYDAAQQHTERLTTLYRISTAIAASLDLEVITATALEHLGAVLPLDRAEILLISPTPGKPGQRRVWRSNQITPLETTRLPSRDSLLARVLADGGPRVEPWQAGATHDGVAGTQDAMCVVLQSEQQICGAVELVSQPGYHFSAEELQFMVALAVPLALAIEKARLHADIVASEARYWALLEYANDAVLLLDATGKEIIDANRSLEQLTGYSRSALRTLPLQELFANSWQEQQGTRVWPDSASRSPFETTLRTQDGVSVPVSVGVSRVPHSGGELLLLIVRDISEQQRVVQQVVQAEKLAAIGRLAASIAHEVNNPLQAIYNSLDLLRKNDMSEEKRQRYLDLTFAEAERLIGIVNRLIDFHRPSRDGMRPTQVLEVIDGLLEQLGEQMGQRSIAVVREWQAPQPRVMAIRSHLKQVCTNLLLNALDAMPEGGTLTIRVYQEREERAEGRGRQQGGAATLVVEISDTGSGIAAQDLPKIFEPFYTTKVTGTGLGLAISYSIVQQHGGELTATSSPGNGTTFRLALPVVE